MRKVEKQVKKDGLQTKYHVEMHDRVSLRYQQRLESK
jgi:hypothetical protein